MGSTSLDEWWAAGERTAVPLGGEAFEIFERLLGSGPWLTLLHGFPSSS